jgi:imidazolonepropionase-like amidohydrolase
VLILSACGPGGGSGDDEDSGPVVAYFENGSVILGDGSEPIDDIAIVVIDGIITDMGPRDQVVRPPGAEDFNLSEHTVLPFMVNVHGHVGYQERTNFGSQNYTAESVATDLGRYIYYGVGAVAVMGTDLGDTAIQIRDQQQAGTQSAARILTAGRGITANRGFPSRRTGLEDVPIQVGSEAEARAAVQELAAQGVDFVKLWVDANSQVTGQVFRFGQMEDQIGSDPKLSQAAYTAAIDEAHMNNIRVVAHMRTLADAKALVAAGVDGLIHSIRDRAVDSELIDAMIANDVFFVPTLAAHEREFVYGDEPEWIADRSLRESVSGAVISRLRSPAIVAGFRDNLNAGARRQEFEIAMENFKIMFDAGVRIGLGSDSGAADTFPGFWEHHELEMMVRAGLTPVEAIQIATEASAQILGIEDMGALQVGNRGNFYIVPGKPGDEITDSRSIAEVFVNGERLERSSMAVSFTN